MASNPPYLVGLGGSMRDKSYSRAALREALKIAEASGAQIEMLDLRELNLPMYVPNLAIEAYPAAHQDGLRRLLAACRRADAMLWSSPTYHGTISGILKNALDCIDLMDNDDPPYLASRAVGLIALSDGATFGAMQNSVYELRAWLAPTHVTLNQSDDFNADLTLKDGHPQRRVTRLIEELMEFGAMRASKRNG